MSGHIETPRDAQTAPFDPLVSVLVANYNYAGFVEEALQSLAAQTYTNFEAIVCDDGSTDSSRERISRFARHDARVTLIAQPNGGVASALNTAYAASRGALVLFLDADDTFAPDKLARTVAFFQAHLEAGFLQHALTVTDSEGRALRTIPTSRPETGRIAEQLVRRGGRWRNLPTTALAFRREVAAQLFPLPEKELRANVDGVLFGLAPLLTEVGYLPEPLATYRLHGANLTGQYARCREASEKRLEALERVNRVVNRYSERLGLVYQLDLDRHLNYREHRFERDLYAGHATWRDFRALALALLRDDLYSPARKLLGIGAYGGALLLPPIRRAALLDRLLSRS